MRIEGIARQARSFARLMFEGKVNAALRMVSDQGSMGVLDLDQKIDNVAVGDILKSKHPVAQEASPPTHLPRNECK